MTLVVRVKSTGSNNTAAILQSDNLLIGKSIRASCTSSERQAVATAVEKLIARNEFGSVTVEQKPVNHDKWLAILTPQIGVNEPTTLDGYLADLEKWGCEIIEDDDGEFRLEHNGRQTRLENTSQFAAAYEAWHLMKP